MVGEWRGEDAWSRWLLHERFGDDACLLQRTLALLAPIRERVLDGAELGGDEVVLDVGAGDGLVGFGALDRLRHGQVVFTDLSAELLSACERIAAERASSSVAGSCRPTDVLRAQPETAAAYATLKWELTSRYPDDREAYSAAKTAFVEKVLAAAR